jgi:endonuclease III
MPTRSAIGTTRKTARTSRYFTRQRKRTVKNDNAKSDLSGNLDLASEVDVEISADETAGQSQVRAEERDEDLVAIESIDGHVLASEGDLQQHADDRVGREDEGDADSDAVPAVKDSVEQDSPSLHGGDAPGDGDNIKTRAPPIPEPQPSPQKHQQQQQSPKRKASYSPRKPLPKLSPYFPLPLPLIPSSCLPFPPISSPTFGLIQEQLSTSPFKLLIATIFLNRTRGPVAIPVLFQLFASYPSIASMASANHADIVSIIRGLGFQNQRATKFIALAQKWLQCPPARGRRYRKLHYPCKRDGVDVAADEVVRDDDQRVAWEIAHLPGVGAYAIDSWRIFCRDRLRHACHDEEEGEEGQDKSKDEYEPEWKRVLPQDKELRAYLNWMWLKEGWVWNCENGQRTKADADMMKRAEKGGIAFEGVDGHLVLMNMAAQGEGMIPQEAWVRKAGFSLDCS